MAFDQPIEADRVDDLNLFSTFIRAPIVGTIMWILGGHRAREEDEEDHKRQLKTLNDELNDSGCECSNDSGCDKSKVGKSALKKTAPSLIGSECSDFDECSAAMESMHFSDPPSLPLKRRKKVLSWSDKNGKKLVEIIGEANMGNGQSQSSSDPVTRSSLTRTRSVADQLEVNSNLYGTSTEDNNYRSSSHKKVDLHRKTEPRYLPRGLDKEHNGIIMPKHSSCRDQPYKKSYLSSQAIQNTSSMDGEIESPQWGWFLRTTPPTPQMYQSHPKYPSMDDSSLASIGTNCSSNTVPAAHPNPVFQGLQDNSRGHAIDWSGVPL